MFKSKILIATALGVVLSSLAVAQTATPVVTDRQANQSNRISQGVASGELTKREAAGLRAQQRSIAAQKKMAKADGVVTRAERSQLQASQNRASANIYKQKHDAQKR